MTEPFLLTTCAIGIASLVALWVGPLSTLCRDNYRADIRRLRDDLFDFMWMNGYSFQTPAYLEVRQMLNGMLRWANVINLVNFTVSVWFVARNRPLDDSSANRLLDGCDPRLRGKIESTLGEAVKRTLRYVLLEGTTGVCVRSLVALLRVFGLMSNVKSAFARRGEVVITQAYLLGGQVTPAQRAWLLDR